MMRYPILLFDAEGTLMDFEQKMCIRDRKYIYAFSGGKAEGPDPKL